MKQKGENHHKKDSTFTVYIFTFLQSFFFVTKKAFFVSSQADHMAGFSHLEPVREPELNGVVHPIGLEIAVVAVTENQFEFLIRYVI